MQRYTIFPRLKQETFVFVLNDCGLLTQSGFSGCLNQEAAECVRKDFGSIDILVHSLANGPEVKKEAVKTEECIVYNYFNLMAAASDVFRLANLFWRHRGKAISLLSLLRVTPLSPSSGISCQL